MPDAGGLSEPSTARHSLGDSFGDTPEQSSTEACATDCADDNEICLPFGRDLDERCTG